MDWKMSCQLHEISNLALCLTLANDYLELTYINQDSEPHTWNRILIRENVIKVKIYFNRICSPPTLNSVF